MKVLIEIDDKVYEHIREHSGLAYAVEDHLHEVEWAIKNGTELPQKPNADKEKVSFTFLDIPNDGISRVGLVARIACGTSFFMPYTNWIAMMEEIAEMPSANHFNTETDNEEII